MHRELEQCLHDIASKRIRIGDHLEKGIDPPAIAPRQVCG
jgi:hypothetical protein